MEQRDVIVIGGGPAGAAAAMRAARGGASVVVFEKGTRGRDKVCGDGLTPRAVAALEELKISLAGSHRIDGLRMIAGDVRRELPWPGTGRFPPYGAVWTRRALDAHLIEVARTAGAEVVFETAADLIVEDDAVVGVHAAGQKWRAPLVVLATGAPGEVARLVGAQRDQNEPFGLAIRTYVESPRHADRLLEASLAMRDPDGTAIPGYGWMFPVGDGTVNLGVGALSTMKGFKKLNLNKLVDLYRDVVRDEWEVGEYLEKPRAWRLPMAVLRRSGPGWVAVGDAAGLINPMNGEGIDYALESGMLAADLFLADPASAATRYDREIGARFDDFLRTGRRFSFLIGHPFIVRNGLRLALGTDAAANITLQVMGNLVDADTPGASGRVLRLADRALAMADPVIRRTRARA
ncbi:MAG: NAD(P)/FAD-dependent oxidoreductase [Acidimicrobiales bacterium]